MPVVQQSCVPVKLCFVIVYDKPALFECCGRSFPPARISVSIRHLRDRVLEGAAHG